MSAPKRPLFREYFKEDGSWLASFQMLAPEKLEGTWSQDGSKVCVSVHRGDWGHPVEGKTVCRDIIKGKQGYKIPEIISLEDVEDVTIRKIDRTVETGV